MSVKKAINQIGDLGQIIETYNSITAAAAATEIDKSNIRKCLNNPNKYSTAGKYFWEYADQPTANNENTIWFNSIVSIEQELIKQITINHNGSKKMNNFKLKE